MARRKRISTSVQPDLFQQLAERDPLTGNAEDLDIGGELLGAVSQAIREAKRLGLSRERIVELMNLCLPDIERKITVRQLNAWTAQSKEFHEFPARYLPAFCWATGSLVPLLVLARPLGHDLVDHRDQVALALGQKLVHQAQLGREVKSLKRQLED